MLYMIILSISVSEFNKNERDPCWGKYVADDGFMYV